MTDVTYCSTCDFVHNETRRESEFRWLCTRHKRLDGRGFTSPNARADAPYLFCKDVNGGACPLWEPRRETKHVD